jgi:hypothetical protein
MAMGDEVVGYEGSMPEARTLAGLWFWLELAGEEGRRTGPAQGRVGERNGGDGGPMLLFLSNDREIANTSSTK